MDDISKTTDSSNKINPYISQLSLIQNDYFNYAVQNSTQFVRALIDPVLNYLGIKDYEIISVES